MQHISKDKELQTSAIVFTNALVIQNCPHNKVILAQDGLFHKEQTHQM